MKKKLLLILNLFFFSFLAKAQNPVWINYTSGYWAQALADDGNFLWVGTIDGLIRFEKSTGIKTYYYQYNSGLPSNGITAIAIDAVGNVWVGTDSGLAKFNGNNWTTYLPFPYNEITAITFDGIGNTWVGTRNGIAKYNGTSWAYCNPSNSGLPDYSVNAIAIDAQGNKKTSTFLIGQNRAWYRQNSRSKGKNVLPRGF